MNKLLLLFAAVIGISSCKTAPQVDAVKQARIDDSLIRVYLSNNPVVKAVKIRRDCTTRLLNRVRAPQQPSILRLR
ncbi:hypothetical protein [Mucilaginibacter ginsenosidivorax]|uniref:Uncharacterized protein n=1 Tax=Mucilaginibacter ginsenosidivorax TaxID=862126 RepID=A0A5B8VZ48_9SPHI|nr:hypothetical protein [Mucilaginibacter ginsenosidivorax]QEC76653.1 hypothetical protein FSB76_12085 [Mucilaginibacter ginsenosidivorax]